MNTSFGDINVDKLESDYFSLQSEDGDINLTLKNAQNGSLKTDSGDIILGLKSDEYNVIPESRDGDFINNGVSFNRRSMKRISCVSQSGDITIESVE